MKRGLLTVVSSIVFCLVISEVKLVDLRHWIWILYQATHRTLETLMPATFKNMEFGQNDLKEPEN